MSKSQQIVLQYIMAAAAVVFAGSLSGCRVCYGGGHGSEPLSDPTSTTDPSSALVIDAGDEVRAEFNWGTLTIRATAELMREYVWETNDPMFDSGRQSARLYMDRLGMATSPEESFLDIFIKGNFTKEARMVIVEQVIRGAERVPPFIHDPDPDRWISPTWPDHLVPGLYKHAWNNDGYHLKFGTPFNSTSGRPNISITLYRYVDEAGQPVALPPSPFASLEVTSER